MGRTISHYHLLKRLGVGGMGEVYKAEDRKLKRTVAIKFISPEWLTDHSAKLRLLEEVQALAGLNHPGVAIIYAFEQGGNQPYIGMEYVKGETLARKIASRRLEISVALDIAIQASETLKAAHEHGLIHGDIKSTNIMLTPEGNVKMPDFGLANSQQAKKDHEPNGQGNTEQNRQDPKKQKKQSVSVEVPLPGITGTASYMSSEQARGDSLDARTDIYSVGVVPYEMLAARRPFTGEDSATVLHAILRDEPPPLSTCRDDIPIELESIVRKALAMNRDERYHAAAEMLSDLSKLKEQVGTPTQLEESTANFER